MTTGDLVQTAARRIGAGEPIPEAELRELAALRDVLGLGMLADSARRRVRGSRVSYLRVADVAGDREPSQPPPAAREVRLTGPFTSNEAACAAVRAAKAVAGSVPVSGWSLADLADVGAGAPLEERLASLREAGLDLLSEVPLDRLASPEETLDRAAAAGFTGIRLTVDRAPASARLDLLLLARRLASRTPAVAAVNPLPMVLSPFRPTTGYEDVRMVALARLAVPATVAVQVDWRRYGPKLAQVALTFGADDLDHVSADDGAAEGGRRTVLADVRRNIEAAGFEAIERDAFYRCL